MKMDQYTISVTPEILSSAADAVTQKTNIILLNNNRKSFDKNKIIN